ncbi:MAG: PrgI family protein, partial [Patescibacteria group bacterium]|nr:PrgI family protein [Patescibacteria group bacterium]
MQFRVPQNIDLEDKVIGPMTLKQFVYVLAGGMLDYVCFLIFDTTLFILLALPITLFFLAMAFAKVQDQPFPKFLQNFIIFLFIPKQRVWNKKAKPVKLVSKKLDDNTEQKFEPKDVKTGEIE